MGTEIERKFLVRNDGYRALGRSRRIRQGYLSSAKERVVRVRTVDDEATLTVKGAPAGAVRLEFEYAIPLGDAGQLLAMCEQPLIEKTRYEVVTEGLRWEIDEFHGANEGLVVAECELASADQTVRKPAWVGEDVTGDPRYYHRNLVTKPFTRW